MTTRRDYEKQLDSWVRENLTSGRCRFCEQRRCRCPEARYLKKKNPPAPPR